jgi:hypothetical protein
MNAKAAVAPSPANVAPSSRALAYDPLDDILTGFYRPPMPGRSPPPTSPEDSAPAAAELVAPERAADKKPRPTHYKVVCISLYVEDIDRLDSLVAELKRRGHTKANKSQVIRAALEQIDLDQVPRSH